MQHYNSTTGNSCQIRMQTHARKNESASNRNPQPKSRDLKHISTTTTTLSNLYIAPSTYLQPLPTRILRHTYTPLPIPTAIPSPRSTHTTSYAQHLHLHLHLTCYTSISTSVSTYTLYILYIYIYIYRERERERERATPHLVRIRPILYRS